MYILNWISFVVQNPIGKTSTVLVLTGGQGVGKTWFTDSVCELFGDYATKNETNIEHITGKFNSSRMNKKLIVINEVETADDNKKFNFQAMKSVVSEDSFQIERKGVDAVYCQAVDNFIICSNNVMAVKLENDDRRYVICDVNQKYKNDKKHFKPLYEMRKKTFYEHLLTFFMKRDISDFIPGEIPMTKNKKEIQLASENSVIHFIREYNERFGADNWATSDVYKCYREYCSSNGFKTVASNRFGIYGKAFIEHKLVRINGNREYRYFNIIISFNNIYLPKNINYFC